MRKPIVLLNLFLFVTCIWVGHAVYRDYKKFDESHKTIAVQPEVDETNSGQSSRIPPRPLPLAPEAYMTISKKILFLQSRNLESPESMPKPETAPVLRPKPVLMGVVKVGDEPRAFVRNVGKRPGQRSTTVLKQGEVYRGYTVSQIHRDRVELSYSFPSGNVTTEILDLYDPAKRRANASARTPVVQSQVIQVGKGAASQTAPAGAVNMSVDAQGRRVIKTPFGDIVQGGQASPAQKAVSEAARRGQLRLQQERQKLRQKNTPTRRNEIIDDQGRRIIRTPFGDIVRKPKPKPPSPH